MPRENVFLILLALVLYALCSTVTLRDRILVETLHRIENEALAKPSAKLLFEGAMSGMTRKLNWDLEDDYSAYIPPKNQKEYVEELENRFDGIGIVFQENPVDKTAVVLYPILDSPAHLAGIRSGDRIISINGEETQGMKLAEITEFIQEQGKAKIVICLSRYGKTTSEIVSLRRDCVLRPSVEGDRIDHQGKRQFRPDGDLPRQLQHSGTYRSGLCRQRILESDRRYRCQCRQGHRHRPHPAHRRSGPRLQQVVRRGIGPLRGG